MRPLAVTAAPTFIIETIIQIQVYACSLYHISPEETRKPRQRMPGLELIGRSIFAILFSGRLPCCAGRRTLSNQNEPPYAHHREVHFSIQYSGILQKAKLHFIIARQIRFDNGITIDNRCYFYYSNADKLAKSLSHHLHLAYILRISHYKATHNNQLLPQ